MTLRERIAALRATSAGDPRWTELVSIVERLEAQNRRTVAEQARLEERLARVEKSVVFRTLRTVGGAAATTKGKLGQALLRSPFHPLYAKLAGEKPAPTAEYAAWVEAEQKSSAPAVALAYRPLISVLMPVYRPRREWIEAAIASVQAQSYENWQLCLCCDGPADQWLDDWLRRRVCRDPRVRVAFATERHGIASALNGAGTLADGEYITFLDQDDMLAPAALYFLAEALQQQAFDVLYSDEDWMTETGQRIRPNFKPDWSPELLIGCMYFGHMFAARRDLIAEAGWFRNGFEGAQDYDLALRLASGGASVKHVARILYHWRMHQGSTAAGAGAKPHAHTSGKRALEDALRTNGTVAKVKDGPAPHTYVIGWTPAKKSVSVVICSRTADLLERCLDALRRTTEGIDLQLIVVEHQSFETRAMAQQFGCTVIPYGRIFNFADMNNVGAADARHDTLLFLNDDVTAQRSGWLESLLGLVERPEIAIAGAKLVYPSGAIQHAGIALGIGEGTGHIGRGQFASDVWRWLNLRRNVSAVTGACMAIRRSVFQELNGFDTSFAVNYNDVDLCLRARAAGYEVVYEPAAILRHDECATRGSGTKLEERELFWDRWGELIERPDPYFTPYLDGEEMRLQLA
jgi:GT2 family glycosyltransferase